MKKFVLSIFILGSFGLYVLSQSQGAGPVAYVAPQSVVVPKKSTSTSSVSSTKTNTTTTGVKPTIIPTSTPKPVPVATPKPTPVPTPAPVVKKTGQYNDGTYTGSVADAYYGNVQVEAVITGGRISNVIFLDYPQDRSTSRRINSVAMPGLTQEAISAQSANVNGVSGASDTSAAFKQSLASALAQARA
jgi:uncharacterized protein with FMN-binding domain